MKLIVHANGESFPVHLTEKQYEYIVEYAVARGMTPEEAFAALLDEKLQELIKTELGGMEPDICDRCGKVLGYGVPAFHLGRCEDCAP